MAELRKVAVIGGSRIPFCRSSTDYHAIPNKKLMTRALRGLVSQYDLKGVPVGEVILGAVLKHARDFSLARETAIDAGLAWETPGLDIQRACGTSLEAAILIAHKIAAGQYDSGIAAGVDTSSEVPIELPVNLSSTLVKLSRGKSMMDRIKTLGDLNPSALGLSLPAVTEPRTGLSMGEHCEIMAKEWSIARADQDELAARSHNNAEQAYERGFFGDLVTPFKGVEKDNNVRPGTTPDKISKLGPAFDRTSGKGTLTAANSSPLTDGAAAVLLATEEWARSRDLPIQAWFTHSGLAGVDYENKEGLLMAPAYAVPQMLDRAGLTLQDFDFYEIHEAFEKMDDDLDSRGTSLAEQLEGFAASVKEEAEEARLAAESANRAKSESGSRFSNFVLKMPKFLHITSDVLRFVILTRPPWGGV